MMLEELLSIRSTRAGASGIGSFAYLEAKAKRQIFLLDLPDLCWRCRRDLLTAW